MALFGVNGRFGRRTCRRFAGCGVRGLRRGRKGSRTVTSFPEVSLLEAEGGSLMADPRLRLVVHSRWDDGVLPEGGVIECRDEAAMDLGDNGRDPDGGAGAS